YVLLSVKIKIMTLIIIIDFKTREASGQTQFLKFLNQSNPCHTGNDSDIAIGHGSPPVWL
ncbi:hypothetical protein CEXT_92551, partial [Caerostris extrusa]